MKRLESPSIGQTSALVGAAAGTRSGGGADPEPRNQWPMWGGTPDRNMVSAMKGLPTTWDVKSKKNIKWIAELGSQTYGNPVVSGGIVLVGTNNEAMKDPKSRGTKAS